MVCHDFQSYWELCRDYREGKISRTTFELLLEDLVEEHPRLLRFRKYALAS